MKKDFNIDDVLDKIEKAFEKGISELPPIKVFIGKDEDGKVTNYIEITNGGLSYLGTGIGGFKIYLEQSGGICPDIVVNGVLMDEEEKKAIIKAVLEGRYLRLDDED